MTDITTAVESNHKAVNEFLTAAEGVAPNWTTPRAAGNYSIQ